MKNELCNHLSVCFLSLLIGISKKNSFINLNTATLISTFRRYLVCPRLSTSFSNNNTNSLGSIK